MGLNIAPLCIIQARYNSTRLPGKMLLKLGDETLIERAFRLACEAFYISNVVIALPNGDMDGPLGQEILRIGATYFAWDGPEDDVLGRFYNCANRYRWHPDSVIVRWTPDDPFKSPSLCQEVALWGRRYPVEIGAEAFTLRMLNEWWSRGCASPYEHISRLMPTPPPSPPPGCWTIDTQADYEAAKAKVAHEKP